MKVGLSRPQIDEIGFSFHDRSIHPEFFEIVNRREFAIHAYKIRVIACLTRDGHMIEYRHERFRCTEVLGSFHLPRPLSGLNHSIRIKNHHQFDNQIAGYATSRFALQREILNQSIFDRMHEEIAKDAVKSKLKFQFSAGSRFDCTAVSYITVNTLPGAIALQSFHTFPDDRGIMKTQTLIEFDSLLSQSTALDDTLPM